MDFAKVDLTVEAPGKKKPLASLPRGRGLNEYGERESPIVVIDLELGKHPAGCAICDIPIPPNTTRVLLRLWLRTPRPLPDGKMQETEKYYLHPGCITDRVKPEVIRTRMDCYDCGAIPPQSDHGFVHWGSRCFTVSKFAHAPICDKCTAKPRWLACDACLVWFPHHMVDTVSGATDQMCEYCARRHNIPRKREQEQAEADFAKLRAEIAEHGIFGAGDD